jgi:hypothetical protein
VWCHEGARQDWLRLPARALATLLGHEATAVHHENTALVALGSWLEAAPGAAGLGAAQRAELLSLVREEGGRVVSSLVREQPGEGAAW